METSKQHNEDKEKFELQEYLQLSPLSRRKPFADTSAHHDGIVF